MDSYTYKVNITATCIPKFLLGTLEENKKVKNARVIEVSRINIALEKNSNAIAIL